jgi:hypothetical protein
MAGNAIDRRDTCPVGKSYTWSQPVMLWKTVVFAGISDLFSTWVSLHLTIS